MKKVLMLVSVVSVVLGLSAIKVFAVSGNHILADQRYVQADPNATDPNAVDPNAVDPNAGDKEDKAATETDPNAADPNAGDKEKQA